MKTPSARFASGVGLFSAGASNATSLLALTRCIQLLKSVAKSANSEMSGVRLRNPGSAATSRSLRDVHSSRVSSRRSLPVVASVVGRPYSGVRR
jgi:hypothetical protein